MTAMQDIPVASDPAIADEAAQVLRKGECRLAALRCSLARLAISMDERDHLAHRQLALWEIRTLPRSGDPAHDAQAVRDQDLADAIATVKTLLRGEGA